MYKGVAVYTYKVYGITTIYKYYIKILYVQTDLPMSLTVLYDKNLLDPVHVKYRPG